MEDLQAHSIQWPSYWFLTTSKHKTWGPGNSDLQAPSTHRYSQWSEFFKYEEPFKKRPLAKKNVILSLSVND